MDKCNNIDDQAGFRLLLQMMLATKINGAALCTHNDAAAAQPVQLHRLMDKYRPGVTLNSNKEPKLPTNMSDQPSQTPPQSTITLFPNAEDGTEGKRQIEDLIQQQNALEADDHIIIEGDRLTRERLDCVPPCNLEHLESGHNVHTVGLFHTQLVAYSLMLKMMTSDRTDRDTNSKS
jgi:hypothetical protein